MSLKIVVYSSHEDILSVPADEKPAIGDMDFVTVPNEAMLLDVLNADTHYLLLDYRMPNVDKGAWVSKIRSHVNHSKAQGQSEDLVVFLIGGQGVSVSTDFNEVIHEETLSFPLDWHELAMRIRPHERRRSQRLELRALGETLQSNIKASSKEIAKVQEVQIGGLPREPLTAPLNYAWYYEPSDFLSGDSLNVVALNDRWVGFYILDVCGHGIPSAVDSLLLTRELMLHFNRAAWYLARGGDDDQWTDWTFHPSEIISRINLRYNEFQHEELIRYSTMVLGFIDTKTGFGHLCRAGHPGPLILGPGGLVRHIEDGDPPVGLIEMAQYSDIEFKLEPGQRLMLYTDGCLESTNKNQELFGLKRLISTATACANLSPGELLQRLRDEGRLFAGHNAEQVDDYSLLVLEMPLNGVRTAPWHSQQRSAEVVASISSEQEEMTGFRKLLIVEDSRSLISVMKQFLSSHGYEVRAVPRAEMALDVVQEWHPDLIVTDWDLPGLSGLEMAKLIQASVKHPPYIVMVSGAFDRYQLLASLQRAADDFMAKPIRFDELLHRLNNGRKFLQKRKLLTNYNNKMRAINERIKEDLERISMIKRSALPRPVSSGGRLEVSGLMSDSRLKSNSQVSAWPISDRLMAFFVFQSEDKTLLGMFRSFLIELEFQQYGRLFGLSGGSGEPTPVNHPEAIKVMTEICKQQGFKLESFDLVYGLINLNNGEVTLNRAVQNARYKDVMPSTVLPNAGSPILLEMGGQPSEGFEVGFNMHDKESRCGFHFKWRATSELWFRPVSSREVFQVTEVIAESGLLCNKGDLDFVRALCASIHCHLDEMVELSEQVEEKFIEWGISEDVAANLRLVFVELSTNVLRHGHTYGADAFMTLYLIPCEDHFLTVFSDLGREVPKQALENALTRVEELTELPVEDMPTGGFGLSIITCMPEFHFYIRKNSKNYHVMRWPESC